jgi:hypothetical protein
MKEVSVLLARAEYGETLEPIGVFETANKENLRTAVEVYILSMFNWGDEQKDEFDNWVDEIADSLCYDSEYDDKDSEVKMRLYTTKMF